MSLRSQSRHLGVGLLFLLPNILGFLAFILVPLVMSFGMAFTDWDFLRHNTFRHEPLNFIGLVMDTVTNSAPGAGPRPESIRAGRVSCRVQCRKIDFRLSTPADPEACRRKRAP